MTDEELGRKWAERHGKRPFMFPVVNQPHPHAMLSGKWAWSITRNLPESWICHALPTGIQGYMEGDDTHHSESAAYAALGCALRRLLAFADGVREVMGHD